MSESHVTAPRRDEGGDEIAATAAPTGLWGWMRLSRAVRFTVGLILGALALYAVGGQRSELAGVTSELSHLNAFYVLMAVVVEFISFLAFARMQGCLLESGEVHMRGSRLLGMTVAASDRQGSSQCRLILYRIVSFWAFLPCGWAAWGGLAMIDKRADRKRDAGGLLAPAPVPAVGS
ncbi:MAG: hypothetical protein ACRD0Z_13595 [Acidimicrobiales bacterium]